MSAETALSAIVQGAVSALLAALLLIAAWYGWPKLTAMIQGVVGQAMATHIATIEKFDRALSRQADKPEGMERRDATRADRGGRGQPRGPHGRTPALLDERPHRHPFKFALQH